MAEENTNYVAYLIELSQQGRRNSFFDLCEINQKDIVSLVYYILADLELTKKIILNIYLHAWDNIREFKFNQSYLYWIKDLAIKHSVFELNRAGFNNSYKKYEKTSISELHQLDRLILSLPDEDRTILVLHDMEDYKLDDIKKYLNHLSVDEMQTKLINAREYLIEKI